jgi:hypothetical protein
MSVHCFEVFEFKSRFEFNCLSVFKIETLFYLTLYPYPIFGPFCFQAQPPKSVCAPSAFPASRFTTPLIPARLRSPGRRTARFSFSSALLGPSALQPNSSPLPFQPRAQPNPLFWPSSGPSRGRPAAVADGRAPPVIPDLESETDWGQSPTPRRPPPRA